MFKLTWTEFRDFAVFKNLNIQYIENSFNYRIWVMDNNLLITCDLIKNPSDTSDLLDFENNYKSNCNKSTVDSNGRIYIRSVACKTGWTYFMCPIEFTTSKLSSIYCKKHDDTNRAITTYKIYDSNGTEITEVENEGNAVKTILDIEPTYDYEIIGGQIQQHTKPTTPIRLWVVAVPDISENYGGTKEMVGGVNLKFIDPTDKVHADGRVSKYMTYNATYHTNKMRIILRHDAGVQHDLLVVLEMFKA